MTQHNSSRNSAHYVIIINRHRISTESQANEFESNKHRENQIQLAHLWYCKGVVMLVCRRCTGWSSRERRLVAPGSSEWLDGGIFSCEVPLSRSVKRQPGCPATSPLVPVVLAGPNSGKFRRRVQTKCYTHTPNLNLLIQYLLIGFFFSINTRQFFGSLVF